jgi:hypothetical protein
VIADGTNALVEFRPLRDNDWCGLLKANEVVLVVAEELQRLKDSGGRARSIESARWQ